MHGLGEVHDVQGAVLAQLQPYIEVLASITEPKGLDSVGHRGLLQSVLLVDGGVPGMLSTQQAVDDNSDGSEQNKYKEASLSLPASGSDGPGAFAVGPHATSDSSASWLPAAQGYLVSAVESGTAHALDMAWLWVLQYDKVKAALRCAL